MHKGGVIQLSLMSFSNDPDDLEDFRYHHVRFKTTYPYPNHDTQAVQMTGKTMFETPFIAPFFRILSIVILKLSGWRIEGTLPDAPKFVLIAAPHTSSWDGFYMLMVAFVFRVKMRWLAKHTLFRGPVGPLFQWLGGIPINRSAPQNMVMQVTDFIRKVDEIVLAVPPEGTRKRAQSLKTGFYYIALASNIPIVLGFLDYRNKITGVGQSLNPSGDFEADLNTIYEFYAPITGKYKHQSCFSSQESPGISPE